jgi:hypothetical protein
MSGHWIPATLRSLVFENAGGCCEYCRVPADVGFAPHEPDHIIAEQHGGETTAENLALACWRCNRYKGTNLASIDPETGNREFLFNPRRDLWREHFAMDGARIVGITGIGRATAALLRFNNPDRVELRKLLIEEGKYSG